MPVYRNDFTVCSEEMMHTLAPSGATAFAENSAGFKVCAECGGKLETVMYVCPNGANHSGLNNIAPGNTVCNVCGTAIELADLYRCRNEKTPLFYIGGSQGRACVNKNIRGLFSFKEKDDFYSLDG